jgi:hypothetical protein
MIRGLLIVALATLGLLFAGLVRSEEQTSAPPVLRLETGMHTAPIRAAAADAAGRLLATASFDKTVRLWSLSTGEQLRVLRPAIGSGAEGELFAIAVSPDGRFVVTGGWTGFEWEKANSLYVFETGTGQLVRRIGGLPQVINRLAWSPDGRYVAAGLAGSNGIRIYETGDWHEVFADSGYSGPVYGLSFGSSGMLAAASFDGGVRLYGSDLRPAARTRAPGGNHPYSVAFSPDGSVVALGYGDTLNVDILAVPELRRVASADVSGLAGGSLSQVAWTADGALVAGGAYWSEAVGSPIFRWGEAGRGKRAQLAAADGTVTGLVPLPDGGFAYVTADPAFGRYEAGGGRMLDHRSAIADFRGQLDRLRFSSDGARVAFGLQKGGGNPAWFDVDARRLDLKRAPNDLSPANIASLHIGDWQNTPAPRLAGKLLSLEKNEVSRSLAIAPDRRSFVLGTEWYLRRFGNRGEPIWAIRLPSAAWAVNVSGDGRLAVAALADGTIRWYRFHDGEPLLSLFMDREGKRWVMWTPEGPYDASPGGEDLIGWHINRGLDHEADFFGVSRFRELYYRPKAVAVALRNLAADQGERRISPTPKPIAPPVLPPVVRILSPHTGEAVSTSPVEVRYSVRSASGERVTGVDVMIDGRRLSDLSAGRGLSAEPFPKDTEQEASIAIPLKKDATISLVARIEDRVSEAANLRLIWKGAAEPDARKRRLYVLAIGVSRYKDPRLMLDFASADAGDVAAAFKAQEGGIYREVVIRVLRDEEATLRNVQSDLEWIARETSSDDVALVFMAGHGTNEDQKYYFLPADVDISQLKETAQSQDEIRRRLVEIRGKALFFFDTCQSGSVMGGPLLGQPDINGVVNDFTSAENGIVVFAASEGREVAYEQKSWGHGAFTKALLEALGGKADIFGGQQEITVAGLEFWISYRVKQLTDDRQHPTSVKPYAIRDIAIAELR